MFQNILRLLIQIPATITNTINTPKDTMVARVPGSEGGGMINGVGVAFILCVGAGVSVGTVVGVRVGDGVRVEVGSGVIVGVCIIGVGAASGIESVSAMTGSMISRGVNTSKSPFAITASLFNPVSKVASRKSRINTGFSPIEIALVGDSSTAVFSDIPKLNISGWL